MSSFMIKQLLSTRLRINLKNMTAYPHCRSQLQRSTAISFYRFHGFIIFALRFAVVSSLPIFGNCGHFVLARLNLILPCNRYCL